MTKKLEPDYETDYGEIQNWDVPDICRVFQMSERGGKAGQVGKINGKYGGLSGCGMRIINFKVFVMLAVFTGSKWETTITSVWTKTKNKYFVYKNRKKILTFTLGNQGKTNCLCKYIRMHFIL